MRTFSAGVMLNPGACSPSRSVVSKMRTRARAVMGLWLHDESGVGDPISQSNNRYGNVGCYLIVFAMELSQLEAFLAVVRGGQLLGGGQGALPHQLAISQTIKQLEDEIGHPLFDRASRGAC